MKASVLRALLLSLVLGGLFPSIHTAFVGYGVDYRTPMDPAKFYAMSYEEQQQWLRENEIRVSGSRVLSRRLGDPRFWMEYVEFAAYTASLLFLACMLMSLWERSAIRANRRVQPRPASGRG